jgi:DNA damage-binding protein 1
MTNREGSGRVLASNGNYIEVLDTWQNVGPILDAVLADTDSSGQVIVLCAGILCILLTLSPQPRIITASGAMNASSLRIIQSGADFEITALIENIANFSKIWPLRSRFYDS